MNINHNKPYRWLLSMMLIMVVFVLGSCSKEPSTNGELSGEAIYINLSSEDEPQTRAPLQTDNEKLISSAFILFYGTEEGTNKNKLVKILDPNDCSVSDGSKIVISASLIDTKQTYKIVVLANGGPTFSMSDIIEGTDIQELSDKVSQIQRQIPTPTERLSELLMSGTIKSHTFSQNPIAKVTLVRQAVKLNVKVTMNKTFTDNYPDAKFGMGADGIDAPKLSVLNVPTKSYLIRRATPVLPSKRYIDYLDLAMTASATEWTVTAYAYENPINGTDDKAKSEATYFILQLPYKLNAESEVVTDNYYKFYINDPKDATNPHKTISNTLYNVSVAVNGFGGALPDINGAQVITTVLPWDGEISQTDPVGEYLKVSSETITVADVAENKLVISSSLANSQIEFTNSDVSKFTKSEYNSTTGEIALVAKRNTNITEVTQIATLTVKNRDGKMAKTIKVMYEPLIWAPGDIVLSNDSKYIIGEPTTGRTMIFQGGAKCGVLSNSTQIWESPATRTFYDIGSEGGTVSTIPATNYVSFTRYSESTGKGDPCKYIDANNAGNIASAKGLKWRSPTGSEISLLLPFPSVPNKLENGSVSVKNGIRGWQFNKNVSFDLFFPYQNASGDNSKDMSAYGINGSLGHNLVGYRWTNSADANVPPQYYAILCDDIQTDPIEPRRHHHVAVIMVPMRCVRDFSR